MYQIKAAVSNSNGNIFLPDKAKCGFVQTVQSVNELQQNQCSFTGATNMHEFWPENSGAFLTITAMYSI